MERARKILPLLEVRYPEIQPLLEYTGCFQLLTAVILSAQCTDARVNMVTPVLFEKYAGPRELAEAPVSEIESIIYSTGFYKNKARHLRGAARAVWEKFGGSVPEPMDELLGIPGIGRKSANVIRAHCFGLPAVIVDTHFSRVVRRLGLTSAEGPARIEREIALLVPEERQTEFSMRINLHGRYVCTARKPDCGVCILYAVCEFRVNSKK
jgi:endonuclease III